MHGDLDLARSRVAYSEGFHQYLRQYWISARILTQLAEHAGLHPHLMLEALQSLQLLYSHFSCTEPLLLLRFSVSNIVVHGFWSFLLYSLHNSTAAVSVNAVTCVTCVTCVTPRIEKKANIEKHYSEQKKRILSRFPRHRRPSIKQAKHPEGLDRYPTKLVVNKLSFVCGICIISRDSDHCLGHWSVWEAGKSGKSGLLLLSSRLVSFLA